MSTEDDSSARSLALLALIVAGTALTALALRAWGIGDKSIWLDEAWSWRAARLPLLDMVDWTAQDRHPPLYYGVLHFWVDLFGDSEASLRMPSALAGTASAAVLAYAGWRSGGWVLALLAGGLLAVHPTHVEFAQEARMYPLLGLLALTSSVLLAALIDRPTILRAGLFALVAGAAMYSHYSAVLLLLVFAALIAGYAVARWPADGRRIAVCGLGALALVGVAYLPWYRNLSESAREGVGHLPNLSIELVDLVWSALLGLQSASDFWLALAIPAVCFGVWGVAKRLRDPYVVCVAAIALVPIMQLVVSWLRTPVLDVRQASPYIAGYAFLLAIGLREAGEYVADVVGNEKLRNPLAVAGACGVGVVMLIACADWFGRGPREDWRQAASDSEGVGTVYIWRGYISEPMRYYTPRPLTPIAPNTTVNTVEQGSRAVLILSHNSPDEAESILASLGEQWSIGEMATYPGIQLYPLHAR